MIATGITIYQYATIAPIANSMPRITADPPISMEEDDDEDDEDVSSSRISKMRFTSCSSTPSLRAMFLRAAKMLAALIDQ